ncbi:cytochrome P450 [Actinomadura sp. J1-007]|nr:cytochrome P450 [Actinomadura sp. J1-007]
MGIRADPPAHRRAGGPRAGVPGDHRHRGPGLAGHPPRGGRTGPVRPAAQHARGPRARRAAAGTAAAAGTRGHRRRRHRAQTGRPAPGRRRRARAAHRQAAPGLDHRAGPAPARHPGPRRPARRPARRAGAAAAVRGRLPHTAGRPGDRRTHPAQHLGRRRPVVGPGLSRYELADLSTAQEKIYRFFLRRLPDLTTGPGDHLLAKISAADALDQRDLVVFAVMMFMAGYRTSASFLAGAIVTLLRHPDTLSAARADPELIPAIVEELLRYTPMATGGAKRLATADTDLNGLEIKAGELVLVSLEAANHDPAAFSHPDTFNPGRDTSGHLGFGHGAHFCPGNRLARMQIHAMVTALADHSPALRLAVPPHDLRWVNGAAFRTPQAIPVTW